MKYAKNIYTIVCDDVREEKGSKLSLMGIYQRDIVVNKIPSILKQLSIVVFLEDLQELISEMHITVKFPKSEAIKASVKVSPGAKKGQNVTAVLELAPLKLNEVGDAIFGVRFDNLKRSIYIRKLAIKKREAK